MFYLIGRALDKTFVNFDEKGRFSELKILYRKCLSKIGISFVALVLLLLCGSFVWIKGLYPTPAHFLLIMPKAKDAASQKLPQELQTSLSPRMSSPRVQSWLRRSLIEMHSMNFINYQQVLDQTRVVFRPDTYETYLLQMNQKKGLIPEIRDKSLVMSLTPLSEVRILDRGSTGKYRVWKMQMVGLLVRSGSIEGNSIKEKRLFNVLVEEVPTTENPYGLVIAQYSTRAASN